ncbi:MAG: DUF3305 domain-containing protein [Bradyrhizobiaceae bacterium]|nr:DUF3305 domain-containing protein [Bradyrhizobiaceae bacterium]
MSRGQALLSIPVGVVIERRKAKSPWADFVWRPVVVLPGVPAAPPWTVLEGDDECTTFYGGAAAIELHRSESSGYRDNLSTGAALLWVVLHPTSADPPYMVATVTADPSEGEACTESATNLVETVPMPEPIRAAVAEFVAENYVEHRFVKRQRDRADPDVMARRIPVKDRK